MSLRTDRVRLVMFLRRKSTLTREEFSQYWSGTHAALFSSLEIVKTNLIKYEQAHINESVLIDGMKAPMPEWDGMVIFEGESHANIFEVFQSEEFQRIIIPDAAKFLDTERSQQIPFDLLTVIDK
ncbi:hypothetical protein FB451DRAFT_1173905 [Mycena latifolia]|nr:hypothetical protein FB451DRAFT_1173905 [Mycena latifolia]